MPSTPCRAGMSQWWPTGDDDRVNRRDDTAHTLGLPAVLAERLARAHPEVLRELLATFIHVMGAESDATCGAQATANAVSSAPAPATGISSTDSIPAQAHWSWRSPS